MQSVSLPSVVGLVASGEDEGHGRHGAGHQSGSGWQETEEEEKEGPARGPRVHRHRGQCLLAHSA